MSSAGSSSVTGEGITDRCFECDVRGAACNLFYFTCPACPGPNRLSEDCGVGRIVLCEGCINNRACSRCHRRPTPDDYHPYDADTPEERSLVGEDQEIEPRLREEDVPQNPLQESSSGDTGGSIDRHSSRHTYGSSTQLLRQDLRDALQELRDARKDVAALSQAHMLLEAEVQKLQRNRRQELEEEQPMQSFVKVRMVLAGAGCQTIWFPKSDTIADAISHVGLDADWTAAYDDAEVLRTTRLGDMKGSSPVLELAIYRRNAHVVSRAAEENLVRRPQQIQESSESYCLFM